MEIAFFLLRRLQNTIFFCLNFLPPVLLRTNVKIMSNVLDMFDIYIKIVQSWRSLYKICIFVCSIVENPTEHIRHPSQKFIVQSRTRLRWNKNYAFSTLSVTACMSKRGYSIWINMDSRLVNWVCRGISLQSTTKCTARVDLVYSRFKIGLRSFFSFSQRQST